MPPTADADLSIDRSPLNDIPLLEKAMRHGGFELSADHAESQPGQWFQTVEINGVRADIPVDLLIPERFSGSGKSRRTPSLDPYDRMAVRKVDGSELATVDNDVVQIDSLEPSSDLRSINIKVAGVPALLVAKAYKILRDYETHHNQHRPHRSLQAAAPLKPLPEPVDLDQYRVRKRTRAGDLINDYRLVA